MDSQEKPTAVKFVMDFREMLRQLVSWMQPEALEEDSRLRKSFHLNEDGGRIIFKIFTQTNEYSIVAQLRQNEAPYLGACSSCRKPRAGEDWHRGNDLADGEFCKETWNRILAEIVSTESVDIKRPIQELYEKVED